MVTILVHLSGDRVCSSNGGYPGRLPRTFHQAATGGGMMRAKKSEYGNYYQNQGARFQTLARYLGHCHVIINCFANKFYYNFPPGEEEQQTFEKFVKEHFIENEEIQFDDIDYDSIFDFLENGMMQIKNRDIRNLESFKKMELYCIYMFLIYLTIAQIKEIKVKNPKIDQLASINTISSMNELDYLLFSKSHQLIGYWTAKMEEKIRRHLSTGPLPERELKQKTNYNKKGLWVWESATKNLQRANEIFYNKRDRVWEVGSCWL